MKPPLFIASSTEGLGVAYAFQSNLQDCTAPTVWDQGAFQPSSANLESLIQSLDLYKFGVFVFSNDDVVRIRGREQFAPRDNVVFEMGLFVGRLGRERNFIVQPDNANLRLSTDLLGVVPTMFDATRPPTEYRAALGPACHEIRLAVQRLMAYDLTHFASQARSGVSSCDRCPLHRRRWKSASTKTAIPAQKRTKVPGSGTPVSTI